MITKTESARDILEASLEFESSNLTPSRQPFDDRRSSSVSLYPTIESIEDAELDNIEIEEAWEAAGSTSYAATTPVAWHESNSPSLAMVRDSPIVSPLYDQHSPHPHHPPHRPRQLQMLRHRHRGPLPLHLSSPQGSPRLHHHRSKRWSREAEDDDEMLAMKLAAYEGRGSGSQVARMPDHQAAEATIIDHDIHPSDISINVVQAALVGQDYRSYYTSDTTMPMQTSEMEASQLLYSATEALVLDDSTSEITDLDRKPPARDYPPPPPTHNDQRHSSETTYTMSESGIATEATVVDYVEESPSNLSLDAVRAEFVGQDYNAEVEVEESDGRESQNASHTIETELVQGSVEMGRSTTEATVIDSAPMEKATADAWSGAPAEEARVLQDELNIAQNETLEWTGSERNEESFAMASGEVVGISQGEFLEDATQAELIGTDSNLAVAIPTIENQEDFDGHHSSTTQLEDYEILEEISNHGSALEEAQVLPESEVDTIEADSKRSPINVSSRSNGPSNEDQHHTEREAQVVEISEIGHPSEFEDNSFQAELIGTDPNGAIAAQPSENLDQVGDINILPPATPVTILQESTRTTDSDPGDISAFSEHTVQPESGMISDVLDMLFHNSKQGNRREGERLAGSLLPRTLLPYKVNYSENTGSWVTTVNINQDLLEASGEENSKHILAFSVPTKKQALCLARSWAPPKMHPPHSNSQCFICEKQFAVFKRRFNCRNCGVCICNSCSVQWPSRMLPNTYNIKDEATMNVCRTCDWLSTAFRLALLDGDRDKATALHATGNINLTTPFANVKGELFYPVHCAVLGDNLKLLEWLVDENCCPLRSIRVSGSRSKDSSSYTPILTSKGRSPLAIALEKRSIDIVRYLVVTKSMSISAEKLSTKVLSQNLDLVLRMLPDDSLRQQQYPSEDPEVTRNAMLSVESIEDSDSVTAVNDESLQNTTEVLHDACILCLSNNIDCVATPCGHQMCCLECSTNLSRCPVCAVDCTFLRVFRP